MKYYYPLFLLSISLFFYQADYSQLIVDETKNPEELVEVLTGVGVDAFNVSYNGVAAPPTPQVGSASFTTGASPTALVMDAGIILSTAEPSDIPAAAVTGPALVAGSVDHHDTDLQSLSGFVMNDCAVLEFDFIPQADTLRFNYVFASEEYPTYVCSSFNDAFGFFISGPGITGPYSSPAGFPGGSTNIALIPGTTLPVTINNVNDVGPIPPTATCTGAYSAYYVNNTGGPDIAFNGFTVVLEAVAVVVCNDTFHIKLAVGNASDHALQSAVFVEANSFRTDLVEVSINTELSIDSSIVEGCTNASFLFSREDASDTSWVTIEFLGNAINGVDFIDSATGGPMPTVFTMFPGQYTDTITITPVEDFSPEGKDTLIVRVFTLTPCGDTIYSEATMYIADYLFIPSLSPDLFFECPQSDLIPIAAQAYGTFEPYEYVWNTGDTGDTIYVDPNNTDAFYTVEISDMCGGYTSTDTVFIDFEIPPDPVAIAPEDTTQQCVGDLVTLVTDTMPGGSAPYSYQWTFVGGPIHNTQFFDATPTEITAYMTRVIDACGRVSEWDTVTVYPRDYSNYGVEITYDSLICPGDEIDFFATVTEGAEPYTYMWYNHWISGSVPDGSGPSYSSTPVVNTIYHVDVIDDCGVLTDHYVTVLMPVYDPIGVAIENNWQCIGRKREITSHVEGGAGEYNYVWDITDDFTGIGEGTVIVNVTQSATYTLNITDQCGNTGADDMEMNALNCNVVVPNIITPNGDRENEYLIIQNIEYHSDNSLVIYNRWGKKVYEADNYQNGWNAEGLSDGVYYYVLSVPQDDVPDRKGSITVMR